MKLLDYYLETDLVIWLDQLLVIDLVHLLENL